MQIFSKMDEYDGQFNEEDAFYDDPTLISGRRATAFIVDMSSKMFEHDEHGDYYLKRSLTQLRDYLNSIALGANMSEHVSIIFINLVS